MIYTSNDVIQRVERWRHLWSSRKGLSVPVAVRIAVVDPLPLFQQGVCTVLSNAGYTVETPVDPVTWARRLRSCLILMTMHSETDWERLITLCQNSGAHQVTAVVEASDAALSGVRAVRSGARSILFRDARPEVLRHTVEATLSGQAVMPPVVTARLLSAREQALSADESQWLRRLAAGATVTQLAGEAGYSERAMYRMLRDMYQRMGVRTRLEAIMRAQEFGWL